MKDGRRKDKNLVEYYKDGQWHREDGPAVEYASGDKYWYQHGNLHRENGPAIEYANGVKYWFLEGLKVTEEEFSQWLDKKKLNEKLQTTLPHKPITRRGKI